MNIFTHLRGRRSATVAVAVLAAASLVCLLLVPVVASQTLSTGLVLGGIGDCVPTRVHAETLAEVEALMPREDRPLVEASFTAANRSGVRTYMGDPAGRSALARALEPAEASWWRREADGVPEGMSDARAANAFVRAAYLELGLDLGAIERAFVARGMRAALALAVVALAGAAGATTVAWFVARQDGDACGPEPAVGDSPLSGRAITLAPAAAAVASVLAAGGCYLVLPGAPPFAVDLAAATIAVLGCLGELGLVALLARCLASGEKDVEAPAEAADEPAEAEILVFPVAEEGPEPTPDQS